MISNLCKCIVLQLFIQYEAVWSQQKRVLFYFRTVQFLSLKIPLCKIGQLINEFQSNTHYLNGEWLTSSLGADNLLCAVRCHGAITFLQKINDRVYNTNVYKSKTLSSLIQYVTFIHDILPTQFFDVLITYGPPCLLSTC